MTTNTAEGVCLGLACGDALGRPVEFRTADEITATYGTLTAMEGNGTWGKPAGTITDDTDLACCIARSLVACNGFDPADVAGQFIDWYDSDPFDIGIMTAKSIRKLKAGTDWTEAGRQVWEASPEGSNAGNGSVMRCPPLAIPYAHDWETLAQVSRQSSQITHADPRCTQGCAVLTLTIAGYLTDEERPLRTALEWLQPEIPDELLVALEPIAEGERPNTPSTSGYVVHTLQTALHDALSADTAEEAIVSAVNRGGDADTIGAVAGAVAGARFGASALPDRWLAALEEEQHLRNLAADLRDLQHDQ